MMDRPYDRTTNPPRCDYATCTETSTDTADSWHFCPEHLAFHALADLDVDQIPDIPRRLLPFEHGTEAGYAVHKRRGETPCGPCMEGNRLKSYERNVGRHRDRWHRRKDAA